MWKNVVLWLTSILFSLLFYSISSAEVIAPDIVFRNASNGIREAYLHVVAVGSGKNGTTYAASAKTVYKTVNHGKKWKEILSFRSTENIVNIVSVGHSNAVYVGTDDGLFKSTNKGKSWKNIFKGSEDGENAVLSIAFNPKNSNAIIIGTKSGLFTTNNGAKDWVRNRNFSLTSVVSSISISQSDPRIIFVFTNKGLYRSENSGTAWKRLRPAFLSVKNGYLLEQEADSGASELVTEIRSILIDSQDSRNVYLATSKGLFISRDSGTTWDQESTLGLLSRDLRHIVIDPSNRDHLFAATGRGVFRYSVTGKKWMAMYKGLDTVDTCYLAFSDPARNNKAFTLWAATKNGIYKTVGFGGHDNFIGTKMNQNQMDTMFAQEPTIEEIRRAAIEYAEVHPNKISTWRTAAAKRAWLPDLRFAYGKGTDWQSSTYFYSTAGEKYKDDDITEGNDDAWSVSLTWELGNLIWNSEQASIDNRSKLMVQLRGDILVEVTRLFYERRRLQYEITLSPAGTEMKRIEKELRLNELTAHIDALTGSYLSKRLCESRP